MTTKMTDQELESTYPSIYSHKGIRLVEPDLKQDATCCRVVGARRETKYCKVKDGIYWEYEPYFETFVAPFCKIEEIDIMRSISGQEI